MGLFSRKKCGNCYYYMDGSRTAMTPEGTGTCNLGQRQPFTVTQGQRLKIVSAGDKACSSWENGEIVFGRG